MMIRISVLPILLVIAAVYSTPVYAQNVAAKHPDAALTSIPDGAGGAFDPGTMAANVRISDHLAEIADQNAKTQAEYSAAAAAATAKAATREAQYAKEIAVWKSAVAQNDRAMDAWKTARRKAAQRVTTTNAAKTGTAENLIASSKEEPGHDMVVDGTHRVCRYTSPMALTGSLVVQKRKRVCYDKDDLARNSSETDRATREMVRPAGGNIYHP